MFKYLLTVVLFLSVTSVSFAQKDVLVIQSYLTEMSGAWMNVLSEEAIDYDFKPYSVLDSVSVLLNYKVIIYTDDGVDQTGILTVSRKQNLWSAIKNKRSLYVQSEYQSTYEGNIFFSELTDSVNGSFEWSGVASGTFEPTVLAPFNSTPYSVSQVFNFWYGIYATYDSTIVKPFLKEPGGSLGYYIDPSNPSYGKVVTMTDRDFFMSGSSDSKMLLKNIISYLIGNSALPVELSSFRIYEGSNGVLLKWSTATETNNAGWEIERSTLSVGSRTQGDNYPSSDRHPELVEGFQKIGFVAGKGTTTEAQNYSFTDAKAAGKSFYRLKQIDNDGVSTYSDILSFEAIPTAFSVSANYPNPFNPTTNFRFDLPKTSNVKIVVSNILGQQVATVANREFTAGTNIEVPFNAASLSSGLYYYTITANGKSVTKTMMLMK